MINKINLRYLCVKILLEIDEFNFSEVILDKYINNYKLNQKDAAFLTYLTYSVLENLLTIDYNIKIYCDKNFDKFSSDVKNIIRIGVAGIFYMDSINDATCVNESVKLCSKFKKTSAKSLVNAVLRKISKNKLLLPNENDKIKYLSIKHSISEDIINLLFSYYDDACEIIKYLDRSFVCSIRVNTLKTTQLKLCNILKNDNIEVTMNEDLENNLFISKFGNLKNNDSFKKGLFFVQDTSSQLITKLISPKENDIIIDACSSPGGKSFSLSMLTNDKSTIYSFDKSESKKEKIDEGIKRLGIRNIKTFVKDSSKSFNEIEMADIVLCDVPCSSIGVISKKPEIRYKTIEEVNGLFDLQLSILNNCSKYVKIGKKLVYTTCTLNKHENEDVINEFLKQNKNFCLKYIEFDYKNQKEHKSMITLKPNLTFSDGFFIAILKRVT